MLDLDKLESLAMLKLTESERAAACEYFDLYIKKFDGLAQIDTQNIEPLISVSSLENIMRDDISYKIISRDKLLETAPHQQDGYIIVPRILE